MSDRREPTISGMRIDPDDPRVRAAGRQQAGAKRPVNSRPAAPAPQRPVIVKSKLAPIAFVFALAGLGAAGYFGWQSFELQKQLKESILRLEVLEEKLVMSDDETSASSAALQASLKEAHSEIGKLWGVAYDRNRKNITKNESALAAVKKTTNSFKTEVASLEKLVEQQKTKMKNVEESAAIISSQARSLNEKNARTEQKLDSIQEQIQGVKQDIEAINGFRRTVNQQLLQLKNGTSTTSP